LASDRDQKRSEARHDPTTTRAASSTLGLKLDNAPPMPPMWPAFVEVLRVVVGGPPTLPGA